MKYKNEETFWNLSETVNSFYNQPYSEYWLEYFKTNSDHNNTVLDLGCGGGRNSEMLINYDYDIYACDKHSGMVQSTRKRLESIGKTNSFAEKRVIQCSMNKLPYANNFFDLIISHGVFHNARSMVEFKKSIEECARVLKPHGKLCYNLFTSDTLAEDFKKRGDCLYVTKENLLMVLVPTEEFLKIASKQGFRQELKAIRYKTKVSTGSRSVVRGVLVLDT